MTMFGSQKKKLGDEMDPVKQNDVIESQDASANPADDLQESTDVNDENNNVISENENNNMAAEESSALEANTQEEKNGGKDEGVVEADGPALSEEKDDPEKRKSDANVDPDPNKEETPAEELQGLEKEANLETTEPENPVEITEGKDANVKDMGNSEHPPGPKSPDDNKATNEQLAEAEVAADDAPDEKSLGDSNAEDSLVPTPTPATKIRLNTRKHTTTPADDSGLAQPVLPTINKGQANVHQMTTSITHARRKQDGLLPLSRQPVRNRVPPKLVRLATVTVSPAKSRPNKTASLYYEEPRRPTKVITWDQATNHRPPLRIDMEGPGPCSYSPLNKPLGETNAPCFTFGTKCYPEKDGGARTSWGKSWFQSHHLWHSKADYSREGSERVRCT
ncbi:hypothetical protein EGW08_008983 [Elysia chlorotica]|uniref:Uncharacterized protein n=1 Tax=Elysia chlorotica TaxID=188477 RepID=A0A433TP07_ELYCH|nr:hypothetical protein EGW08_008983 [Elysia chlorotica]